MTQARAKNSSQTEMAFMGDLSHLQFKTEYRSLKEDPAREFYKPCLLNATLYKRAVGYFRSSVYLVVGPSMLDFAKRGGRISLICSPELTAEDIAGIAQGYAKRNEVVERALISQIDKLLAEEGSAYQARILATLIAIGALEIQVALRADRNGIYHEKIGIFKDSLGNAVSFKGSSNETWSAWHIEGNFESIEVFCSWRGGLEATRVRNHETHFDTLWSGKDPDIEVFNFPDRAVQHLKKVAFSDLDEAERVGETKQPPRQPLPHQLSALAGWDAADRRGIFEHATGSGKTYTGLLAIRRHVKQGNPAIVLVPSRLLLDQWAAELRSELPDAAILLAGGGHRSWRNPQRLRGMTNDNQAAGERVVLATMATAASDDFRRGTQSGPHLLVVADEVHQIGSPENSKFFEVSAGARLGLSATPKRYGDPAGTAAILRYFGDIIPPRFTLADAIKAERLVPYEYYPRAITLTAAEADAWKAFSKDISLEIARQGKDDTGKHRISERAKLLIIKRSRIAKKAVNKIELARSVLKKEYKEGQHWLVYCEDSDQLAAVKTALSEEGMNPIEYHSAMPGDREATLSWFKSFGGPLVSIRCLDEGVDIPVVSHALILASSQNPRQFIQRRGRVLRKVIGKQLAVIHDAIVVPVSLHDEPEQTSLLQSELLRSIQFASSAINKMAAAELRDIAANLGMTMDNLIEVGVEEDDSDE
jgi:superfamily II DNA or RNA helicase